MFIIPQRNIFKVSNVFYELSSFVENLPQIFDDEGEVIYSGRNILKKFIINGYSIVVKSYCAPVWINRFVYRFFRKTKAQRSFEYAGLLRNLGIGSPAPIGYYVEQKGLFIGRTYFACLESALRNEYRDMSKKKFENEDLILKAVADVTAKLHENGILHTDYSTGNILFDEVDGQIAVEIIDLNRIRFRKVNIYRGCRNFDRLPGTQHMLKVLSDEYAEKRNFDKDLCFKLISKTHTSNNKFTNWWPESL